MALFKILRGDSSKLFDENGNISLGVPFNDGYCYFTPDTKRFYIDWLDETNGEQHRDPLNAELSNTLLSTWSLKNDNNDVFSYRGPARIVGIDEGGAILNDSNTEIPTSAVLYAKFEEVKRLLQDLEERLKENPSDDANKMNVINPTGTGSFSLNRVANTPIGDYSSTTGNNNIAIGEGSNANGEKTVAIGKYSSAEGLGDFANIIISGEANATSYLIKDSSFTEAGVYPLNQSLKMIYNNILNDCSLTYSNNQYYLTVAETLSSENNIEEEQIILIGKHGSFGDYSHIEGYLTQAVGNYSHAEGTKTWASGESSHSEGYLTHASGRDSHAEGGSTFASGNYSHAEGDETHASGYCSHAEGDATHAGGQGSHAEGYSTDTTGAYSHAEGFFTNAKEDYSHTEGYHSQSIGRYSHAEGEDTKSTGLGSHSEGGVTNSLATGSHSEGYLTSSFGNYSHAEGYGIDNSENYITIKIKSISNDLHFNGLYSYSIQELPSDTYDDSYFIDKLIISPTGASARIAGYSSSNRSLSLKFDILPPDGRNRYYVCKILKSGQIIGAIGDYSHVEGNGSIAIGQSSHTEGYGTLALGENSHAEGYGVYNMEDYPIITIRLLNKSYYDNGYKYQMNELPSIDQDDSYFINKTILSPEGKSSRIKSYDSTNKILYLEKIIIDSTSTYKGCKLLISSQLGAAGDYSHTEGYNTITTGAYSHAEGNESIAVGGASHAEGNETISLGENSHTEGYGALALGASSHAEGYGTKRLIKILSGDVSQETYTVDDASDIWDHSILVWADDVSGNSKWIEVQSAIAIDNTITLYKPLETLGFKNAESSWYLFRAQAIAPYSHTEGINNCTTGNYSHAEGENTFAWGKASHSEGYNTYATSPYSHAEGHYSFARGQYSHAEGNDTTVHSEAAHSEGTSTSAWGDYSHAEGFIAETSGKYSHAEGNTTLAFGECSHAEGNRTLALGVNSHAEGEGSVKLNIFDTAQSISISGDVNQNIYSISIGSQSVYQISDIQEYDLLKILTSKHKAHYFKILSINIDSNQIVLDRSLSTEGYTNKDDGSSIDGITFVCLVKSYAEGQSSHTEGLYTKSIGNYSHAEGKNTFALGEGSHAEGENTLSYGIGSHTEGYNEFKPIFKVHVEQYLGKITNNYTQYFLKGLKTYYKYTLTSSDIPKMDNFYLDLIGYSFLYNDSICQICNSENYNDTQRTIYLAEDIPDLAGKDILLFSGAIGKYSNIKGIGNIALNDYETVVGQYNTPEIDSIFTVGCGTSYARNNAFRVDTNGNINFTSNVYFNNNTIDISNAQIIGGSNNTHDITVMRAMTADHANMADTATSADSANTAGYASVAGSCENCSGGGAGAPAVDTYQIAQEVSSMLLSDSMFISQVVDQVRMQLGL